MAAAHYQPAGKVEWFCFTLAYKLVLSVESVGKALVYSSGNHLRIDQAVERCKATLEKLHPWEWHQVHGDFVQVYIEVTFKPHRAC
jgi:hypothetical protein